MIINGLISKKKTVSLMPDGSSMGLRQAKTKKVLVAGLALTSLVDAFSILVIYLLVSTTSGEMDLNTDHIDLPVVGSSQTLKPAPVVKVAKRGYYFDEKRVSLRLLSVKLKKAFVELDESEKQKPIIIQADKKVGFAKINPLVLIATKAGFNQLRFAVIQEGL